MDLKSTIPFVFAGQISLEGKPDGTLGAGVTKGNVYLDGNPICDDGWTKEDATVACRYAIHWYTLHRWLLKPFAGCWDMGSQSQSGVLLMGRLLAMIRLSTPRSPARATR